MIAIALGGVIATDIRASGAWNYWRFAIPAYALLALWLSWYLRRQGTGLSAVTITHELLHWAGLVGAVFLITSFVHAGVIGRFDAGIFILTVAATAIYLAGVYIDPIFYFIAALLGLFAWALAFLQQYLYAIVVPGALLAAAIAFYLFKKRSAGNGPQP